MTTSEAGCWAKDAPFGRLPWPTPDSLADHPQVRVHRPYQEFYVYLECEDILSVAYRTYEALTGQEFTPEVPGRYPWPGFPDLGEDWDFDDAAEMQARYPRLWEVCGWVQGPGRLEADFGLQAVSDMLLPGAIPSSLPDHSTAISLSPGTSPDGSP